MDMQSGVVGSFAVWKAPGVAVMDRAGTFHFTCPICGPCSLSFSFGEYALTGALMHWVLYHAGGQHD